MESRVQPAATEDNTAQAPAEGACGLNHNSAVALPKDTDWFFDWPTGYVRYRNGRREALQDRGNSPPRLLLTDAEQERLQSGDPGYTAGISAGADSKPTLTDVERASVVRAIETLEGVEYLDAFSTENDATAAATLRGLLERTK